MDVPENSKMPAMTELRAPEMRMPEREAESLIMLTRDSPDVLTGTVLQADLGNGPWDGLTVISVAGQPSTTIFAEGDVTGIVSLGDTIEYRLSENRGAAAFVRKVS